MKHAVLAVMVVLASCAPAPTASVAPPPEPATPRVVVVVKVKAAPRPAPAAGDASPAAVLRDSATVHDEAFRYAAWSKARTENVLALVPLTAALTRAIHAMQASHVHGRYGVAETRALRTATDALDDFLQHKQD